MIKTLAALRFMHLGQHFMKQGGFDDVSVSRMLTAECVSKRAAQNIDKVRSAKATTMYPVLPDGGET
jgi:hypothetical protein